MLTIVSWSFCENSSVLFDRSFGAISTKNKAVCGGKWNIIYIGDSDMLKKSEIAELERRYAEVYAPDISAEDVHQIVADAVAATELFPALEKPLLLWMNGSPIFGDVLPTEHVSLMDIAERLCETEPDVVLACRLIYLHCSGICPGIVSTAGEYCFADRRIFDNDEPICTAFKTEDGWAFLGRSAADSTENTAYVGCELWQVIERVPKLLPLIAYPFFATGTVVCKEDGAYVVRCPADEDFAEVTSC